MNDSSKNILPPIHLAIYYHNLELAKWLYEKASEETQNYTDSYGQNILHIASKSANKERLDFVLEHFSSSQIQTFANAFNNQGKLALDLAAAYDGNWENCAKLVPYTSIIKFDGIHNFCIYAIKKRL